MKYVAFKRAKSNKNLVGSLPPELITEYADVTLFPQGFHRVEDGWEILLEKDFLIELAKNQAHLDAFKLELEQRNHLRAKMGARARFREERLKLREEKKAKLLERQKKERNEKKKENR